MVRKIAGEKPVVFFFFRRCWFQGFPVNFPRKKSITYPVVNCRREQFGARGIHIPYIFPIAYSYSLYPVVLEPMSYELSFPSICHNEDSPIPGFRAPPRSHTPWCYTNWAISARGFKPIGSMYGIYANI